jgi:YggT family protein
VEMLIGMIILLLQVYSVVIILRSLVTLFPDIDRSNPAVQILFNVTEPVLRPVREMVPPQGGIDLSGMIVIIGITVITMLLQNLA